MIHAHEKLIKAGQKTVTAICGKRVKPGESVIIIRDEHKLDAASRAYYCVGCRALIEERRKEWLDDFGREWLAKDRTRRQKQGVR